MSFAQEYVEVYSLADAVGGSGVYGTTIFSGTTRGLIQGLVIRNKVGSTALALTNVGFVHNIEGLSLTTVPPREYVCAYLQNITLRAGGHANLADFVSVVDFPRAAAFANGLAMIATVVASGAFDISCGLTVGPLRDPTI